VPIADSPSSNGSASIPHGKTYKVFMTRFIEASPDIHHTIEKLVTA
jgi:hypothetical protein